MLWPLTNRKPPDPLKETGPMQWHDPTPPANLAPLLDWPEYLAELARRATERSMKNPIHAEVLPDVPPAWYALIIAPGQERTAAAHLTGRGFGVYLPEFQRARIARGVKTTRMLAMFPGYLLVFVWDIGRHWRRMATCPGVMHPLCADGAPVEIPDRIIDQIQARETELMLHGGVVQRGHLVPEPRKKRKRRKPRPERKDADLPAGITLAPNEELVTISTRSYFANIALLDDVHRASLLHAALGLPLQTALSLTDPSRDWVQGRNSQNAGDLPMRRV